MRQAIFHGVTARRAWIAGGNGSFILIFLSRTMRALTLLFDKLPSVEEAHAARILRDLLFMMENAVRTGPQRPNKRIFNLTLPGRLPQTKKRNAPRGIRFFRFSFVSVDARAVRVLHLNVRRKRGRFSSISSFANRVYKNPAGRLFFSFLGR